MWEKKNNDDSIHEKDTTYSWNKAFTMLTAGLNTMNAGADFAGYTDWRFPNIKELQSIVSYGTTNPAVLAEFSTDCAAAGARRPRGRTILPVTEGKEAPG